MTTSQKALTHARFMAMALLTAQADLAEFPGSKSTSSSYKEGYRDWISYPADRTEVEETIRILIRSLATAIGVSASYPPGA
jgi:hypothetical protein